MTAPATGVFSDRTGIFFQNDGVLGGRGCINHIWEYLHVEII